VHSLKVTPADIQEEEVLMKAPRVRLRTLLLVIALSAVILAGVAGWLKRPIRPHSSVFTGLDPLALLGSKPDYLCDVSGKNANVMFELGLRLAFDNPTIIIKDDKTE
jgi:hypothetical protein